MRNVATYLGLESPESQCGKTTLMALLNQIEVNRPLPAANVRLAAFYHCHPGLAADVAFPIDEGDTSLPGNAELRGILNAGYTPEMA